MIEIEKDSKESKKAKENITNKVEKKEDKSGLIPFSFWEFMNLSPLRSVSLCSWQDTQVQTLSPCLCDEIRP